MVTLKDPNANKKYMESEGVGFSQVVRTFHNFTFFTQKK